MLPTHLMYSKTHEWVKELGDGAVEIGLTDHAQHEMGDLVFINLPAEGDSVQAQTAFGDVESVKAVSDVFSPVTGTVYAVNTALLDQPEDINTAPYDAWLIRVNGITGREELMDAAAYEALIGE